MRMLRRGQLKDAFAGVGFAGLGRLIVRHPLLVIGTWVSLAIILFLTIPSLMQVSQKNPPPFLPEDSQVLIDGDHMKEAFNEGSTGNLASVILTTEDGLDEDDEATYRTLVDQLQADDAHVLDTQDFVQIPELREVMTSKDGKAWQLPVQMAGAMGSGEGQRAYRAVVDIVDEVIDGSSMEAHMIGPAATLYDLTKTGERDQVIIEIATVGMVLTILLIVYRNVVAMLLPLLTIGVALVVAQQVVAGLGLVGLPLGPQTLVLMTGMMMGAGVDYAVFLFSRYQELIRAGLSSDKALIQALGSIGAVIAGSAGTVALTFLALAFTTLGIFLTVGPPLTITIAVGFLASVTMLPALIVLAGRRGWVKPRKDITGRMWRRSGINIVRKPKRYLAVSLVILVALAGCALLAEFNYDDRKTLPADSASNLAYAAMDEHFPVSSTVNQFLLIRSPDQDLRTPEALADMEHMAQRVADLPGIELVRGITRPTGEVLEQAKATWQAGEVGTRLADGAGQISDRDTDLNRLSGGAHQLADVLGDVRNQVVGAVGSVRGLVGSLNQMGQHFGGGTTLDEIDKTASLMANMHSLGDELGKSLTQVTSLYESTKPVVTALNNNPVCNIDPACVSARNSLQRVIDAQDSGSVDRINELGRQLREVEGTDTLDETVRNLGQGLERAVDAARQLGVDDPAGLQRQLTDVQQGANQLADASRQLAEGVQLLVDQTRVIGDGMDQASAFLLAMKRDAADPPMSGFYIPPEILTQDEFEKAATMFISADGHTARYIVQTALDPFSTDAMDQVEEIIETAETARPNTTLEGANISMVGFSAVNDNIRNYFNADMLFVGIATLLVVFIILVIILRALVAPFYLMLSVVLSTVSAVGIGVIFFQYVIDQPMSWNVPGMAFLVLVAVGADYNLLVISRIRDEAHSGLRSGIVRTIGATGGVITSAGLIFSVSMFGLTFSSISNVVQTGFIIGVGLLIDAFIVRTVTVPALAVMIGDKNWWPSKPSSLPPKPPKDPKPEDTTDAGVAADDDIDTEELAGVGSVATPPAAPPEQRACGGPWAQPC